MTDGAAHRGDGGRIGGRLTAIGRAAAPAVLYGLRVSAGVAIALYIAFALQLDNPSWAGTSAAIVAQPVLGASLRKGLFRLIGTLAGAIMAVVLTALFPQDRFAFLLAVAVWCAACAFVSTILRNFAAYAAILAGFTLVIIASSSIPAPEKVFELAVARASEIALGIVCGMGVMALTSHGRSAGRLADAMAEIVAATLAGIEGDLRQAGAEDTRPVRRALLIRAVGLDPVMDQAAGESAGLGTRRSTLRAAMSGLFLALAAWRTINRHLHGLDPAEARRLADLVLAAWPRTASLAPNRTEAAVTARDAWFAAATSARDRATANASERLLFDRMAAALEGLARAANGIALCGDVRRALPLHAPIWLLMADPLPPLVNAARVFAAIVAGALFAIATGWDQGWSFLVFLAVTTLLLSPQNEAASRAVVGFGLGTVLSAGLAAIVKFAALPNQEGFASFAGIVALALTPLAALSTVPRLAGFLIPASVNFMPLLAPANAITFSIAGFLNSTLAIAGGCLAGGLILNLCPPPSPATRTRRLLARTLNDLRLSLRQPGRFAPDGLRRRVFGRLVLLHPMAGHLEASYLLAALTVGLQALALRDGASATGLDIVSIRQLEEALASGDLVRAQAALSDLSQQVPADMNPERQRAAAALREIGETVRDHAAYFATAT